MGKTSTRGTKKDTERVEHLIQKRDELEKLLKYRDETIENQDSRIQKLEQRISNQNSEREALMEFIYANISTKNLGSFCAYARETVYHSTMTEALRVLVSEKNAALDLMNSQIDRANEWLVCSYIFLIMHRMQVATTYLVGSTHPHSAHNRLCIKIKDSIPFFFDEKIIAPLTIPCKKHTCGKVLILFIKNYIGSIRNATYS